MKARKLAGEELKRYAAKLLGSRALTSGELRQKLRLKAADPAEVEPLVETLKGYGVLDDRKLAEHIASARAESGSAGRQRTLSDLLRKRVPGKIAEQAVNAAYSGTDEAAMVEAFLERKYRNQDLAQAMRDPRRLASVYRRLRTAGFSAGTAIRVLKRFAQEAEQLEGLE